MRHKCWGHLLLTGLLLSIATTGLAQETDLPERFSHEHMIGIGPSRLLDTYITPEQFSGTGFTYLYIREHVKAGRHWGDLIEHEADLSNGKDRSGNISMMEGSYNLYWGKYRHWTLLDRAAAEGKGHRTRLHLQAGGLLNANVGFLYAMLNTNNPAQARASVNLMPSGVATFDFPLFRQQFTLRYELNLPLLGLTFSPNYGQSYYEIFGRGNYDRNIVPTTLGAVPNVRQLITLDWQTGKKWNLRIGYLGNYQQAKVNNLKQHVYTHRIMIGLVMKR